MQVNKLTSNPITLMNNTVSPVKEKQSYSDSAINKTSINDISADYIKANFLPVSFTGNAPRITNAYVITGKDQDIPLMATKKNESYVIDSDSQTEIMYGIHAIDYLKENENFPYDAQVVFPKHSKGVMEIDGKKVKLPENSAVMINAGTKAKIDVKKGYPMIIMSKQDYDWYERYGKNANDQNIQNKFLELMYYNSHLYNGEFTPNSFLSETIKSDSVLSSVGLDKNQSKNRLVYDLYDRRHSLSDGHREEIEFVKGLLDKLYAADMIATKEDNYIRFNTLYDPKYMVGLLEEAGFSEKEIDAIMPVFKQSRQVRLDSKFSAKNLAKNYSPELIAKMKEKGIIYDNKKDADKFIYWKHCFGNEQTLRSKLSECGFTNDEQNEIVKNWKDFNNTGFDISGLKFINENVAVYNLNDKLNNWTHEKTNWVTNSTALSSTDGKTPFIGVSMVQFDDKKPIAMSDIRKEEILHSHPNLAEKRQTEIYLVTSGAAALNVVKNGKSQVKILREGELAVVSQSVAHCVNSILGEYEHIVAQVPSAFQYGLAFKQTVNPPEDYDTERLKNEAFEAFAQIEQE